jgi:starch phosphorylase
VDTAEQDAHDAAALYRLLDSEVVPLFNRREAGVEIPRHWVAKIRASLKSLAPRFNATRMVREYSDLDAREP